MVYTSGIRFPCVPSVYKSTQSSCCFNGDRRSSSLSFFLKKNSLSRKILAGKPSKDYDASSLTVAASDKVLVPGSKGDGTSSFTDQLETPDTVLEEQEVLHDVDCLKMEDEEKVEIEEIVSASTFVEPSFPLQEKVSTEESEAETEVRPGSIPPPGRGQRIYEIDPTLTGFRQHLDYRYGQYKKMREDIDRYEGGLELFSCGYEKLGFTRSFVAWAIVNRYVLLFLESALTKLKPILAVPWVKKVTDSGHKIERPTLAFLLCSYRDIICEVVVAEYCPYWFCSATGITYREWAPGAKSAALIGDFNNWNPNADIMTRNEFGIWEIFLPNNADGSPSIPHGSRVKIRMETPSGIKDSIPAWIKFSVQAPGEIPYNGIYYDPPAEEKYEFQHPRPKRPKSLRIYEAHVGMSSTVCISFILLTITQCF
ncbi:hypothetical protein Pint_35900 [Pistacia integerrima]|uniref:Uncharacterized protein n=1 Tax=Pistacia integerrima TaxID=434235 RepID=A0ACC0Y222_9ROSI|nr:hypothetical protein Pint_35900 [Pistacia integerrima]